MGVHAHVTPELWEPGTIESHGLAEHQPNLMFSEQPFSEEWGRKMNFLLLHLHVYIVVSIYKCMCTCTHTDSWTYIPFSHTQTHTHMDTLMDTQSLAHTQTKRNAEIQTEWRRKGELDTWNEESCVDWLIRNNQMRKYKIQWNKAQNKMGVWSLIGICTHLCKSIIMKMSLKF